MVPTFLTYFFSPHLRLEIHSYIVCAKKKKETFTVAMSQQEDGRTHIFCIKVTIIL